LLLFDLAKSRRKKRAQKPIIKQEKFQIGEAFYNFNDSKKLVVQNLLK